MLEKLLVWERDAFFMLNGSDSPFLDHFMWIFTGKVVWLPLAFLILVVLVYRKNWRESLLILLSIALVILLCDQFSSHVCKPLFTRFRPTHHPDFMEQVKVVFGYRGGRYGFISSHAANAFGFALLMTLIFRDKLFAWTIFLWAALTAYTRIYLGVHFITDIIPGALSGLFFGYITYRIYRCARLKIATTPEVEPASLYTKGEKRFITYAVWVTVLLIAILNEPLVSCLR